ncbi:ABC transporter permease [Siculibacillus lacustris]|uniref:ABC transporter permease n=1 Tax=Siculibacillus lacustris TaxID=1549641 RepID=A0A4Q9VXZ7_9HYPH|nr:ABC transporter permease [Siculibacillus lacustris]TBW41379.1 ABC transporter permease [Siculibacillus lacustris]
MRKLLRAREAALALIIAGLVGLITLRAPVFLSMGSLDTIVTDGAILSMMALVQMLAILTRGIDLSVSANMALTGMVVALLSRAHPDMAVGLTMALALGLGLLLGAINGVLIAYVRIPPIVVTLGTMSVFRGLVFQVSGGAWVNAHEMGPGFIGFPTARLFGLTSIVWIAALVILIGWAFLAHVRKGRELYALGGNPVAARYVGIDDTHNLMLVYAIIGLVAGLCGYLWVARYAVAYTEIALGFELNTVAACVIGGVGMAGGRGSVLGCLLGALFLVIIFNALPIIDVSPFWQQAISGFVILAAVILNSRGDRPLGKLILRRTEAAPVAGAAS